MRSLVFVGCNATQDVGTVVDDHDSALLIDPLPNVARQLTAEFCKEEHRGKAITIIEAACWSSPGTRKLHVYNQYGLSSSLGVSTSHMTRLYDHLDLSLQDTIDVHCINLANFMPLWLTTLIVDAQGADLTILKTIEPWLSGGRIDRIIVECDGDGTPMYDGLDGNARADMLRYMGQFPYQLELEEGCDWNPDLHFRLASKVHQPERTIEEALQ